MDKLRIFGVPWHVAHQHSLWTIPNTEWGVLRNEVRKWNLGVRPFPDNAHWVSEFDPKLYDLAVLHLDQQCIDIGLGKAQLFASLNKVVQGIPKIIINHGTPIWPEKWEEGGKNHWTYPSSLNADDIKEVEEYQIKFLIEGGKTSQNNKPLVIDGMKKMIGDAQMITNSFRAQEQWGFGKTIWHGMNIDEFWDLPKEPRSIITLSSGGLDAYYNRELLMRTQERLREFYGIRLTHVGNSQDWTNEQHPRYEELGGFGAYRDFVGRSLIYVNITKESPMPRSRTEAMLSGCCLLTTPYQDADKFINFNTKPLWEAAESVEDYIRSVDEMLDEDGINGIIIPDNPKAISALVYHLSSERYHTAIKIGQRGKETAQRLFNVDRFHTDWTKVLEATMRGENLSND